MKRTVIKVLVVSMLISGACSAMDYLAGCMYDDNVIIQTDNNKNVAIIDGDEKLAFNEKGKPVFPSESGETVIEYSGMATDKNELRSWAIVYLQPQGYSARHYHSERVEDYYITSMGAEVMVEVDGKTNILKTGDHLRIETKEIHQVKNLSQEPVVFIVKCTPAWIFEDNHNVDANK